MHTPRVIVLTPSDRILPNVQVVLGRYDYETIYSDDHRTLSDLLSSGERLPDAIIVPSELGNSDDPLEAVEEIAGDELTGTLPLVVLLESGAEHWIQNAYSAGADSVILSPWNPEQLYLQVHALSRRKQVFESRVQEIIGRLSLRGAVRQALDALEEGMLVLGPDLTVVHASLSLCEMLGIASPPSDQAQIFLAEWAAALVHRHNQGSNLSAEASSRGLIQSRFEEELKRFDEQRFEGGVTVTSLIEQERMLYGYGITASSLSDLGDLERALTAARASRSLCLLAAAVCSADLPNLSESGSPVVALQRQISSRPAAARIDLTANALLEVLDSVLPPDLSIRLDLHPGVSVGMRQADLFQLLGHMLLFAADQAGTGGEVECLVGDNIPGEGITISVSSLARSTARSYRSRRIARLLEGSSAASAPGAALPFGLSAAQSIAERYRTAIEIKQTSDLERKIRVRLPMGRENKNLLG